MHVMPDSSAFQTKCGALPLATYEVGETVLAAGLTSGRLLILKSDKVSISKENIDGASLVYAGYPYDPYA
jgi:hypothetical protein